LYMRASVQSVCCNISDLLTQAVAIKTVSDNRQVDRTALASTPTSLATNGHTIQPFTAQRQPCPLASADWGLINPWSRGDELVASIFCPFWSTDKEAREHELPCLPEEGLRKRGVHRDPPIVRGTMTLESVPLSLRGDGLDSRVNIR
jgi:hypothetical protein